MYIAQSCPRAVPSGFRNEKYCTVYKVRFINELFFLIIKFSCTIYGNDESNYTYLLHNKKYDKILIENIFFCVA